MPVSTATGRRGAMARIRRGLACCAALGVLIAGQISFARACQTTDEAGATPGLSSGWQKLYQIAARFGQSEWPPDPAVGGLPGLNEIAAEHEADIDLVLAALAQSNAQGDLGAPPVPTGDALFDRYALAVDARIRSTDRDTLTMYAYPYLSPPGDELTEPALGAVEDAILAEWEPDFGQDPRYWELRYFCAVGRIGKGQLAGGFKRRTDFLLEAQKRGVATPNTLLLLAGCLFEKDSSELPAVLEEAVVLGPDQAWPYYYRALYLIQKGNLEQGMADLARGNAAANNFHPQAFPLDIVKQGLAAKAPPGSAAVSGAVDLISLVESLPTLYRQSDSFKHAMSTVLSSDAYRNDDQAYEAWRHFDQRYGSTSSEALLPLTALAMETRIRKLWTNVPERELSTEQQETFDRMRGAGHAVRAVNERHDIWIDNIGAVLLAAVGVHGFAVAAYLAAEADARGAAQYLAILDDLAQVHYPELTTPECLLKYEPLTQEELDRLNAARKAARSKEDGQE